MSIDDKQPIPDPSNQAPSSGRRGVGTIVLVAIAAVVGCVANEAGRAVMGGDTPQDALAQTSTALAPRSSSSARRSAGSAWVYGSSAVSSASARMLPAALPVGFAANPNAPKWQQVCVYESNDTNKTLKAYGAEGWELVGGDGYPLCFKRPAP